MTATALLQAYARRIRELRRANADVPETALAPAFQQLLEGLLPLLPVAPRLVVVPEYRNPGVGRPDIALVRQGAPARAFVELKAPAKSADPMRWRDQDRRQFERFKELRCWATCNFVEVRLFHRDEEVSGAAVVPERALLPDQDDPAQTGPSPVTTSRRSCGLLKCLPPGRVRSLSPAMPSTLLR